MSVEDVLTAWADIDDALPAYEEAESFYCGDVDEYFSSDRIAELVKQTGQPYKFNFAQVPVKALLGRTELRSVSVPDDEESTQDIKDVNEANEEDSEFPDLLLTAYEYGDAYRMVLPYTEDMAGVGDDELADVGVEKITLNPKDCRMFYDADNSRRKTFFARRWCTNPNDEKIQQVWRVMLWYNDVFEMWESQPGRDIAKAESWDLVPDESDVHAYGEIPVFHYRTAKPYGVPVHKNAYAPQLAINKMLITQLTTSDAAGWPQRYAMSDDGAVLDQSMDTPDWDSDDDAATDQQAPTQQRRGGQRSALRGGPGTMQMLTGIKEVGQFDAADTDVFFMGPAMKYVRIMAVLCDTPLHDFEQTIIPPSGESRRVAEQPLVNRVMYMQRRFKGPLKEEWKFTLRLMGRQVRTIDVRWKPAYTAQDTFDWQAVQLRQQCGVPTDQSLIEAGYDPDQVATWLDNTTEAMSLAQRVALVVSIADAAQKLSATVSASGGLSMGTADSIMNMLLARAIDDNPSPA